MGKYIVKNLMKLINLIPEMKGTESRCCPHCESQHVVKNGKSSGKQRYICKECGATFNDYTSTILSMTHYPEKWPVFIECTLKGFTLRKSAKETKVSYVTLFYWRHKLLTALKEIKDERMGDVVELTDIYMGYSEKGNRHIQGRESKGHGSGYSPLNLYRDKICVLIAKDHNNNAVSKAFFDKSITKENLIELLDELVDKKTILCTNNRPVYVQFSRYEKVKQYRIHNSIYNLLGKYNIEDVKKYANGFKKWLFNFRGVASKYLNNYISCYKFLNSINFDETIDGVKKMLRAAIRQKVDETYTSVSKVKCAW